MQSMTDMVQVRLRLEITATECLMQRELNAEIYRKLRDMS
jgi:hypothetical protein